MNRHLKLFKRILAQTANAYGEDFHSAFETRDLFIELGPDPSPIDILARGVIQFCQTNGRYNGSELALVAMLEFLGETSDHLPAHAPPVEKELLDILNSGATLENLRQWASRYYE